MKYVRPRALTSALLGVVVLLGALPVSAVAAGSEKVAKWDRTGRYAGIEARQEPLKRVASLIRNQVERGDNRGYAGVELGDSEVVLWWKGDLPASIQRILKQNRAVRVAAAAYSQAELKDAAARVRGALDVRSGKPVHSIKIATDGSGLRVLADPGAAVARSAVAGVGVPVEVQSSSAPVRYSRVDDYNPWAGGALNKLSDGRFCTAGFGVRNGDNARFLLTAAHCANAGDHVFDGTWEYKGTMWPRNVTHDIALVVTTDARDRIYVGDPHADVVAVVDGWDWVYPGEYLCQSGVVTAVWRQQQLCGLRVTRFVDDATDAVEAENVDGSAAGFPGDSGGPVYTWSASTGNTVAKGIVLYGYGENQQFLGFQDFGTANRDYGVYIAR